MFCTLIQAKGGAYMLNERISVEGLGLLIFNSKGELFVIRELKAKPQYSKKAGMLSFPLETIEPFDNSDFETAIRLIKEEADGRFIDFSKSWEMEKTNFYPIPGRKDIAIRYGIVFLREDAPVEAENIQIKDKEIEFAAWMSIEELLKHSFVRVEVEPILSHFSSKYFEKTRRASVG